jgi:hypothetical protein
LRGFLWGAGALKGDVQCFRIHEVTPERQSSVIGAIVGDYFFQQGTPGLGRPLSFGMRWVNRGRARARTR